jgi:hypothetical protein
MQVRTYPFLFLFLGLIGSLKAQTNVRDSIINAPMISATYAYQLAGGDLLSRFGNNNAIGANFLLKTKHNLMLGADWNFIFSHTIKEDALMQNLYNSEGFIQNKEGSADKLRINERGWYSHLSVGYLVSVLAPNKNSGFFATVGAGVLSHKIKIEDVGKKTPQLGKTFLPGYDRLTFGPSTKEFVGYLFLDNRRLINVFAGVEFIQAWTKSLRGYNYDTQQADTQQRHDYLTGFRVGIIIPLYKRLPKDYYYN